MIDIFAATTASFLVSPFVTIIDKSVICNANGSCPMWKGVRMGLKDLFLKPHHFFRRKEFWWIYWVYICTYITANVTESICINKDIKSGLPKFTTTFFANMITSIIKDKELAIMFGLKTVTNFPTISYGLWMVRDILTIMFAFNLPKILGEYIHKKFDISPFTSLTLAQLGLPMAVQFLTTPCHLLALDFYNKPLNSIQQRGAFILAEGPKTVGLRMLRIFPAFGIGGVSNAYIRRFLIRKYGEEK